jgi:hypothetical protein
MYDPQLHLFINDDEIAVRQDMYRMVQKPRRETVQPLLTADGKAEGTAIGYSCVVRDPADGQYRLWYAVHEDGLVRLAVSRDGLTWTKKGVVLPEERSGRCDNQAMVPVGRRVDPFFRGAKLAGFCYFCHTNPGLAIGLHTVRSMDGERLEVRTPGILPGVGDRSSLTYDEVNDEYLLISRPCETVPGLRPGELVKPRVANLWKSPDLVHWTDYGIAVRYDEFDPADLQIYGMQPFRCGPGFLGLVEIYHAAIERLTTQLAWSDDGVRWDRVGGRETFLDLGGEGAWDSHWIVSTFNPPIPDGDRFRIYYTATSTQHASGLRHIRSLGLATIRQDGYVSLEAGRTEGRMVTRALPLERPMKLELNANVYSGYITAEVVAAVPGRDRQPVAGYEGENGRVESVDSTRIAVSWKSRPAVQPVEGGKCYLRFTMKQGSFFSYRWSEVK